MPPLENNPLRYSTPQAMTQHGHEHLHADFTSRVETAMGRALPQMQVRVKNLTLSVQYPASSRSDGADEIPTIGSLLKGAARSLVSRKPTAEKTSKPILHNVTGVFEPGTMTLVLGQPGSGKSSLLKVLSGRFPHAKHTAMTGDITYNGVPQAALATRLPQFVSYVPQRDRHFPLLTVKETLAFAHACCGSELSPRDEAHFTQGSAEQNDPSIVTQQLGLAHCEDTIVGDAMTRGVSGGERKRVTTGEMAFGNKSVTLMDEVSTGLDSAATFDIVRTQRSVARTLRKTVVMALLQPSPEVFALFDFVLLLNEGHVLYHGPRDHALPYFEALGFQCPAGRDAADFLMDMGTDQQHKYEGGGKALRPRTPGEFAQCLAQSHVYSAMVAAVDAAPPPSLHEDVAPVPAFRLGAWAATWLVLRRDLKVTWRNTPYVLGRAAVVVVISLIYSTLFYDMDARDPRVVVGCIFPTILFFTLGQTAQLPLFMDAREIFYKQRGAGFFPTAAYVAAAALNQVPVAALEVSVLGAVTYWLCGFVADAWAFAVFQLVLLLTDVAFAAWFFLLASVTPNIQVAQPLGMMSVLFYILFSGFILVHRDIPLYFRWAYWLNPIAWATRSLAINEYGHGSFDTCVYDGVDYCASFGGKRMGVVSLQAFDMYTDAQWIWYGVAFLLVSIVGFMALAGLALEHMRFEQQESSATAVVATSTTVEEPPHSPTSDDRSSSGDYVLSATPRTGTGSVAVAVPSQPRLVKPVTIAFENLSYSVPNPANAKEELLLLKNISGYARPGTVTALMGSSGAGKTTLLDVIAGRKNSGTIQGSVFLNGHAATDLSIRRATGYCEQMDVHEPTATFREALTFSAFLRQSASVSAADKHASVDEVLDLLGLRAIADRLVRGGSVEQMKRLTIGVELAAQPSVLFLDEPTSGLDARSARLIMDGVRKVASTGRTVVCTIHQPSAEVFQVFDSLLLLKKGGETVFFGDTSELIQYFEAIDGVASLPLGYNPATWMLEAIGAGVGNPQGQDVDFAQRFRASALRHTLDATLRLRGVTVPLDGEAALVFERKRAATEWTQASFLVRRVLDMYWRAVDYNVSRFVVNMVLGAIFALAFGGIDFRSYQGINAGVGMVFVAVTFVGGVAFDSVRPLAFQSRSAFYRERAAQTYSTLWYVVGFSLAEVPYSFASTLGFTAIFFPAVGFSGVATFLLFWLHLSLLVLLQTYIGQLLAAVLPSLEVAATVGIMFTAVFFLFMGFNPPASAMPSSFEWLHKAVPPKYSLAILSSVLFGDCDAASDIGCVVLNEEDLPVTLPRGMTIKQYIEGVFLHKSDELWRNAGIVLGFLVLLRVLALLALRFVNHQKR